MCKFYCKCDCCIYDKQNVNVWVMVHLFVTCLNVLFLIARVKIVIESVFLMMN